MITVTQAAADRIRSLCAEEGKGLAGLRIYVQPGGCTGFQYGLSLDAEPSGKDHVFEEHGVRLVVDEDSLPYLTGAEVDYINTLMRSGFDVRNPNAKSTCACGSSFHVEAEAGQAHSLH